MYRVSSRRSRVKEKLFGDLEQLQRIDPHRPTRGFLPWYLSTGISSGFVDRDPDTVIVLEFADHLPERQRVQVHQPIDPAEVVRIGYPVEFEMSVDQVDLLVGGENGRIRRRRGGSRFSAVLRAAQPRNRRFGIGQDVEFRTQHLSIAGECFPR